MSRVAAQQVRAQQQQTDRAFGARAEASNSRVDAGGVRRYDQRRGQRREVLGQPTRHAGVVDAHLGVVHGRGHLGLAAQAAARAVGVTVDHESHHVQHVLVGAAHPVLHGQEVGPHVLRRTWNKAQHLRQTPQHLHLRSPACGGLAFAAALAAKFLQERHRAAGRLAHVESARAGELDHLAGRGDADHGVAGVSAGLQVAQDGVEVLLQEEHAGDHDIGLRDVVAATLCGLRVACEFRGRMQRQLHAGHLACQVGPGPGDGAGQVGVHGDDHHAHGCRRKGACGPGRRLGRAGQEAHPEINDRSALLRHRGSRR